LRADIVFRITGNAERQRKAENEKPENGSGMFSSDDTIVAIATPPGRGGIGVVRVSGPAALQVASALTRHSSPFEPRHATLTQVVASGRAIDRAVVTFFPAPHSYTGEDVLELSAHGSPVLLREIVDAAMAAGARLAEPGEFTLRAFLRGRLDLVQAEAVQDLVEAVTPLQARAAFDQLEGTLTARIREIDTVLFELSARLEASLDFPEEGYHFVEPGAAARETRAIVERIEGLLADAGRGRLIREGAQVVIVGKPNAGKSSIFNRLAGAGRAIVTEIPGTTRDLLTEVVDIGGAAITLIDTAGLHGAAVDVVEREGIARAHSARQVADLALVILDRSRPLTADDDALLAASSASARVVAANKSDLPAAWKLDAIDAGVLAISANDGSGFDELRAAIASALSGGERLRDAPAITNTRHIHLLSGAAAALRRAAHAAGGQTPEEFVAADIAEARSLIEEVTGARTSDDLLHAIFDRFCIGK
jgi:tRNA modification GTPase